jgi:simple sugar transport system ATP-binding protein
MGNMNTILDLKHITKSFPGVRALSDVDLTLKRGEIHCLAGENGSGKSTLVKIATGVYIPDCGSISINGHTYTKLSPAMAKKEGIQVIYQDLALFDHMTIAENIALNKIKQCGKYIVTNREIESIARSAMERIGVELNLNSTIRESSIGNRQITAICRALALDAKILFMDEPTTALTHQEVEKLFSIVSDLKEKGLSIVFISHKFDEIFQVSDQITVFRDGCKIGDFPKSELNKEKLSFYMTGRTVKYPKYHRAASSSKPFLEVKNLTKKGMYHNITFSLYPGDIVGFIGLLGSGRTELALSLFGLNKPDSGEIKINGKNILISSPSEAKQAGIALLPEDRLTQGLFLDRDINENISSAVINSLVCKILTFDRKRERVIAEEGVSNLKVKTPSIYTKIMNLSGGNQQKAVIAKWISTHPDLFIMDSPTVGIDIGSKAEIYEIMQNLAQNNMAIMLISDEVEEILCNCNKVVIMSKGTCTAFLDEGALQQPNAAENITSLISLNVTKTKEVKL